MWHIKTIVQSQEIYMFEALLAIYPSSLHSNATQLNFSAEAFLWSVLEPYSTRSLFTWKFQFALISSELFDIQIAKFLFDKVEQCYKRTFLRIISIFPISWKKIVPLERTKIERNLNLKENWSKIERIVPLALKWSGSWTRWFLKVLFNWITLFYWSKCTFVMSKKINKKGVLMKNLHV